MSLSSVKSETALRSRLFSSSSSFRRLTCSIFSPPTLDASDSRSPRSHRSAGSPPSCPGPARPEHRPGAASRRSLRACSASLPLQSSWMSKTYLKSDHFNGGGSCQRQKPTFTSDVTLYGAGLHNRSRNRARNWVHSRIWPSRDYFLSTPSTRKTTIVPLLSLVCRTARPAAARTDQMTAATCPRSPCSSSALTASPPREKDPPQPIAAQERAEPAYHPDRRSNVGDASSGRTALPIFQ